MLAQRLSADTLDLGRLKWLDVEVRRRPTGTSGGVDGWWQAGLRRVVRELWELLLRDINLLWVRNWIGRRERADLIRLRVRDWVTNFLPNRDVSTRLGGVLGGALILILIL